MSISARPSTGSSQPSRPQTLPGFETIKSCWDKNHQMYSARILPGEYYVSCADEIISTVLGSCVSACIRDPKLGIGGMNHFMLPERFIRDPHAKDITNCCARYGSFAMEHLINDILANGGLKNRLEIKLFGGGNVMQSNTNVGARNIQFVRSYLRTESLSVASEDLGGQHPRKVLYFPRSGRVLIKKLPITKNIEVSQVEINYQHAIEEKPIAGEIDLF